LSREAKLQLSHAIRLMRRVIRSDGFPETRRRIKLSQWNTVHGDRGQLRNGQSSPAAHPFGSALHRRGRTVPPSARRSSVGRDCVPRDPSGLDRDRSRSRRAVANVRWGALNEGGASGGALDKCPHRVVPAMPRCLPPRSARTASRRLHPFAEPPVHVRYLRTAAVDSIVFARRRSPKWSRARKHARFGLTKPDLQSYDHSSA
jgi:hypothetical protein